MRHYVLVIQSKLCSDALVVSLAVGYMLGGVGLVSKVNRLTDEKWNLDGNAPSSSFAESVEPTGPKLSEAKAGAYYLDAVEPSVQPLADAMTVSFSGNLIATQAASAQAAKALRATAKALRSRTWPDSLTNAVRPLPTTMPTKPSKPTTLPHRSTILPVKNSLKSMPPSERGRCLSAPQTWPACGNGTDHSAGNRAHRGSRHSAGSDISGSSVNKGRRMLAVTVRSRAPPVNLSEPVVQSVERQEHRWQRVG